MEVLQVEGDLQGSGSAVTELLDLELAHLGERWEQVVGTGRRQGAGGGHREEAGSRWWAQGGGRELVMGTEWRYLVGSGLSWPCDIPGEGGYSTAGCQYRV